MQRAWLTHCLERSCAAGIAAGAALVSWMALAQPPPTPTTTVAPTTTPPPATASSTTGSASSSPAPPSTPRTAPQTTASPAPAATAAAARDPNDGRVDRRKRWVQLWQSERAKHRELRLLRLRHRLHELFGGQPLSPALLSELRTHARRIARIHRIKQLAIEQGDGAVLDRVEALLAREHGRHSRAMRRSADDGSSAKDGGS